VLGLEVGLGEHDDGSRAALHGQREVPLEEAAVELLPERLDDEHDVDVRRDDLLTRHAGRRLVGSAPGDRRSTRQDRSDGSGCVEGDPVADDGQLGTVRLPAQPTRDPSAPLAVLRQDVVLAAMLNCDARGPEPLRPERLERCVPGLVPAERLEIGHGPIVIDPCRPGDDPAGDVHISTRDALESRRQLTVGRGRGR
jgi:hypothetical protein